MTPFALKRVACGTGVGQLLPGINDPPAQPHGEGAGRVERDRINMPLPFFCSVPPQAGKRNRLAAEGVRDMTFSTEMAKLVADQLLRFATLNRHQLAGQVENLDFWLAEVRHALAVIDGHGVRFVRLHAAQDRFVESNGITASESTPAGIIKRTPLAVRRIWDRELRQARRALVEAAAHFLGRCRDEGLVADSTLASALAEFAE